MKRALSFALTLILIFNLVGANCLAKSTKPLQSESTQIESQAKVNLSSKDEVLQKVVEQVLAELKKREDSKAGASKNDKQGNSSLPVRILKTLFKPVYWVGKAGVFVVKQILWLILGTLMAILGSVGTTYLMFKTGEAGIKKENMQPGEFRRYLKKMARLFHPDKLKILRKLPEEDARELYQLTTELMAQLA